MVVDEEDLSRSAEDDLWFSEEPEESRSAGPQVRLVFRSLPSLELEPEGTRRGTPSERVVSTENVDPTLEVLILLLLFVVDHEVGGIEGLDIRLAEGKRGRTAGGRDGGSGDTGVVVAGSPSKLSRCSYSVSRRVPELYDLDKGWVRRLWLWLISEEVVRTEEAEERLERLRVDNRRVSGDGASSSSLCKN